MKIKFFKRNYSIEEAFDELESLFSDKQIDLVEVNDEEFIFQLNLPDKSSWYVDPMIKKMNIEELKELPKWFFLEEKNNKCFLQTHFHYNALRAADYYELKTGEKLDCIVHFDDHSDMMPIYKNSDNSSYDLRISKGELSIGNFLTNYLMKNKIDVYHIQKSTSPSFHEKQMSYLIQEDDVKIGNLDFKKIEIREKVNDSETDKFYRKLKNSDLAIPKKYQNIWLDIDLDYFCNRFNRDSDWHEKKYLDISMERLKKEIIYFLWKFNTNEWRKKVKVVTIATSPGFFPVEYLNKVEKFLVENLKKAIGFDNDKF